MAFCLLDGDSAFVAGRRSHQPPRFNGIVHSGSSLLFKSGAPFDVVSLYSLFVLYAIEFHPLKNLFPVLQVPLSLLLPEGIEVFLAPFLSGSATLLFVVMVIRASPFKNRVAVLQVPLVGILFSF